MPVIRGVQLNARHHPSISRCPFAGPRGQAQYQAGPNLFLRSSRKYLVFLNSLITSLQ